MPGDSHVQKSLVGYSPWGHKESKTVCARLHVCTHTHTHTHTHTCNELLVLLLSADLFVLTPFPIVNSVYIFSNVFLTVQREVAVSSQVFHIACNFSRSDVFVKQQTLYKVDYSVSPNIDIQEASIKERKRKKNVTKF